MRQLTQKMKVALIAHFEKGVAIQYLNLTPRQKDIVARVESVYYMYLDDADINPFPIFYEMSKLHYKDGYGKGRANACHYAHYDEMLLRYVIENIKEPYIFRE